MKQFESDLEQRIAALGNHADACCSFVYTELALHFLNRILAALQTSGFIALGRLYDRDDGADTIGSLLKYAARYPGTFRRTELRRRKMESGLAPDLARNFVVDAYEPKDGWLSDIESEFKKYQALYEKTAEPVRHRVFAHAGRLTKEQRDELSRGYFSPPRRE